MTTTSATLERERLLESAREYERKGYRVLIEPGDGDLPEFLHGLEPDMVAYGDRDNVVLESRSRLTLRDRQESLVGLATAVDNRQDWRLELLVTNPEHPPLAPEDAELGSDEVLSRIDVVRHLLTGEQEEAAVLLAWSAVEAALRIVARREDIELESLQPAVILKTLYSLGLLDRADYDLFDSLMRQRNLIAHGYRTPEPDRELLRRVTSKTEELLGVTAA